jgi:hypothetical protein
MLGIIKQILILFLDAKTFLHPKSFIKRRFICGIAKKQQTMLKIHKKHDIRKNYVKNFQKI